MGPGEIDEGVEEVEGQPVRWSMIHGVIASDEVVTMQLQLTFKVCAEIDDELLFVEVEEDAGDVQLVESLDEEDAGAISSID